MGVTKKPRKVTLSAGEVMAARTFKIPLGEVAKAKLPKRGRPVGSKNKPKTDAWDEMAKQSVDWEKLAKQLQEALAAQIRETDAYKNLWEECQSKIVIAEHMSFLRRLKLLLTGSL